MKQEVYALAMGCLALFATQYAVAVESEFKGSYLATGNVSTLDEPITSLNNRLGLSFKPSWSNGNFDFRAESYTEPSFHGANNALVNEHKFETQLNYNHPITDIFGVSGGVLYHTNNTFPDKYFWGVLGLTYSQNVLKDLSLSAAVLAEKKNGSGRVFYDASGTVEYHFNPKISFFTSLHRYENMGEFDTTPTRKFEYEIGVNQILSQRFFTGVSYLHHSQDNDPNDRFGLVKLKLGINF